jgi:hypothetical protein
MSFLQHVTEDNIYYCDPIEVRPGTICRADLEYFTDTEITFDFRSDPFVIFEIEGLVNKFSLSCNRDFKLSEVTLQYDDLKDVTTFVLFKSSFYDTEEDITFSFYKIIKFKEDVKSFCAFDDPRFYDYFETINGVIHPLTMVEFTKFDTMKAITKCEITPITESTGVEHYNGVPFTMNNMGKLVYGDQSENILEKGLVTKKVRADLFNGRILRIDGDYAFIEYYDCSLQDGYERINGILYYEDYLFVTTNKGLCVFDRWTRLQNPIFVDETIKDGQDMTLTENDELLVAGKKTIKKYHIRHDLCLQQGRRILFRERKPYFYLDFSE